MEKEKVIVYVDGFNFYYGLKKDTRWKRYYWIDVVTLFERFMKENQELLMGKYESRFRQSIVNDVVHLAAENYDLKIPEKWKLYQS